MNIKDKITDVADKLSGKDETSDGIHCDVSNCAYHDSENNCHAGRINVGPSFAASCSDTVCSTFKKK